MQIPYERFLSPVEAVQANLSTLALVAAWRVLLMIRVLTVLLKYRVVDAILLVMMFGRSGWQSWPFSSRLSQSLKS